MQINNPNIVALVNGSINTKRGRNERPDRDLLAEVCRTGNYFPVTKALTAAEAAHLVVDATQGEQIKIWLPDFLEKCGWTADSVVETTDFIQKLLAYIVERDTTLVIPVSETAFFRSLQKKATSLTGSITVSTLLGKIGRTVRNRRGKRNWLHTETTATTVKVFNAIMRWTLGAQYKAYNPAQVDSYAGFLSVYIYDEKTLTTTAGTGLNSVILEAMPKAILVFGVMSTGVTRYVGWLPAMPMTYFGYSMQPQFVRHDSVVNNNTSSVTTGIIDLIRSGVGNISQMIKWTDDQPFKFTRENIALMNYGQDVFTMLFGLAVAYTNGHVEQVEYLKTEIGKLRATSTGIADSLARDYEVGITTNVRENVTQPVAVGAKSGNGLLFAGQGNMPHIG